MIATAPRSETQPEVSERGDPKITVASLNHVRKTYGQVEALKTVDLAIRQGALLALLGPNGAGKTTAVKLLLGLARPTAGSVMCSGEIQLMLAFACGQAPCCKLLKSQRPFE